MNPSLSDLQLDLLLQMLKEAIAGSPASEALGVPLV